MPSTGRLLTYAGWLLRRAGCRVTSSRAVVWRLASGLVLLSACGVYDPGLLGTELGTRRPQETHTADAAVDGGDASTSAPEADDADGGTTDAGRGDIAGSGEPVAGSGGAAGGGAADAGSAGTAGQSSSGGGGSGGQAWDAGPCDPQRQDCCPQDDTKTDPGTCGCGTPDTDSDGDGSPDCVDPQPFGWQRSLTVDGAQVSETLVDFPLLVRLTDAEVAAHAASNGDDIYFTAADRTTLLDFELERFEPVSGNLVAWVRMPSLAAGTDTQLFLGYEDGGTQRANPSGVWNGHHNVWHMNQDPGTGAGAILDSTQRAHGTPRGAMTSSDLVDGVAGQALEFDGKDDEIEFTNDITGNSPSTFSGWVQQAADSGDNGSSLLSIGSGSVDRARFLLSLADSSHVKVGFYGDDDLTNTTLTLGAWTFVAWTWDGQSARVYVDGASVFGPRAHSGVNTTGSAGKIGNTTFVYSFFMSGRLDEVRTATAARSGGWIATEYANQRPDSTFLKPLGAAEPAPEH